MKHTETQTMAPTLQLGWLKTYQEKLGKPITVMVLKQKWIDLDSGKEEWREIEEIKT